MAPSTDLDPRKQRRRRVWSWAATIAAIALYVPIASLLVKATKHVDFAPLYAVLLGPPLCALCAAFTLAFIGYARTASPNAQVYWVLLLIAALLGWPVSCASGAVMTSGGSGWLAR